NGTAAAKERRYRIGNLAVGEENEINAEGQRQAWRAEAAHQLNAFGEIGALAGSLLPFAAIVGRHRHVRAIAGSRYRAYRESDLRRHQLERHPADKGEKRQNHEQTMER